MFFFSKILSFYLDNVEKYYRSRHATDDTIIRRTHFACWMTKAKNTHSEYVIHYSKSKEFYPQATSTCWNSTYTNANSKQNSMDKLKAVDTSIPAHTKGGALGPLLYVL